MIGFVLQRWVFFLKYALQIVPKTSDYCPQDAILQINYTVVFDLR